MMPYFSDNFYNPSRAYLAARRVRSDVEEARHTLAKLIGAKSAEIVITAGATESINMALNGVDGRIATTAMSIRQCSQAIPGTAFRERCKAFRTRRYSGAGTAFQRVQSPDKARCQSGLYGRLSARHGWISPRWNLQRGRTVPPRTRSCPTTHGAWAAAMLRVWSGWRSLCSSRRYFRHTVLHLGCPCQGRHGSC